jgi:muramidase (phage lysozyme)
VTRLLGGREITSTAAGAYQFLARTWDEVAAALELPDFSPQSQDVAALWLIRRRGALADLREGRFDDFVAKCAKEWASLPGSPYGQPT